MKLELQALNHINLKDISLTIPESRIIGLVGPSGGGKTTLIRLLAGLETPQSGNIMIDGQPLAKDQRELKEHRKQVGIVFQAFNLFPHLTALENISFPLSLVHKFPPHEAKQRALELLAQFELEAHSHKKPGELSGGQCQRVAILRTIAMKKKLLFLDEPTSALDPFMTTEVLDLILHLKESHMVIASHQMGFLRRAADWIVFISQGKVIESAPSEQFFTHPTHAHSKQFLEQVLKY